MNNRKFLLLLLSFVVFVNYLNYVMPNRNNLHDTIQLLSYKINKEKRLGNVKLNAKQLQLPFKMLFYNGKKVNYSQAMGKFQEAITKAAKGNCTIRRLQWAQVPLSTKWYDVLKINTVLECKPRNMFVFINNLRKNDKIYNIKNFSIYNMHTKQMLQLNMQLISYRIHNEK